MDKRPNFKEIEEKWVKLWNEDLQKYFKFNLESDKPVYVIDSPPPFTSGDAHMGHALNWIWMDFVARFMRLKGYNVYLPQGWDCYGLPTELKVEKKLGIPKEDKEKFLEASRNWTIKSIESMRNTFKRLGFVPDWGKEYKTMDDKYRALVQYTLIKMFEDGIIYRTKHPVLWCPNCKTAVSAQEVGYIKKKGKFVYIKIPLKDSPYSLLIATTRPEMISSCVSVFIANKDYVITEDNLIVSKNFAEKEGLKVINTIKSEEILRYKAVIPLINREVDIIKDDDVEYEFGTGIVWVCTYGDETDVKWQKKYNLPVIKCVGEDGKIISEIGEINGLSIKEAKDKIIDILKNNNYIYKIEEIEHNVLAHVERSDCMSPIELIPKEQFFIKVLEFKNKLLEEQKHIKFYPEHMRQRLIDWINSISWDWNISRNRVWGLAFPFLKVKDKIIPVDISDLPFDPRVDKEKIEKYKKKYGDIEFFDEVLDVWVESSITPIAIWYYALTEKKEFYPEDISEIFENIKKRLPTNLRPQGYEIIRTWLFNTLLRVLLLTGRRPWNDVLINGMVLDEKGRKMSKSLGNAVDPNEVMDKYSPDALRYWALMASHGDDYRFTWKDIETGQAFMIKIWNIARYIYNNTKDINIYEKINLTEEDKRFIQELKETIEKLEKLGEEYKFQEYIKTLRKFLWDRLSNEYIESVKDRIKKGDISAKATLKLTLWVMLLYIYPAFPFIADEIYSIVFGDKDTLMQASFSEAKNILSI